MWAVLASLAITCGLVGAAAGRPARRTARMRRRLQQLTRCLERGELSREDAADGAVLARRLGRPELGEVFRRAEQRPSRMK